MRRLTAMVLLAVAGIVFFAPNRQPQAFLSSNRCCNALGEVRCFIDPPWLIGEGCWCYSGDSGYIC